MENQTRAITWILSQASSLNLSIERYTWIEEPLPGWIDIHCSLNFEGQTVHGWGAAATADLALCKAFAEVAERVLIISTNATTSSGFAAHLSRDDVRKNAVNELLERDQFLCHFFTRRPFTPIPYFSLKWNWLQQANAWARRLNLSLQLFRLGSTGCVCAISGLDRKKSFGYLIGASNNGLLEQSAISAFIEAARRGMQTVLNEDRVDSLTLKEFEKLKSPGFHDHGRLALDPNYAQLIKPLFPTHSIDATADCPPQQLSENLVSVEDLSWPLSEHDDCPFYFARARSPEAQTIFLGTSTLPKLNMTRLERWSAGVLLEA